MNDKEKTGFWNKIADRVADWLTRGEFSGTKDRLKETQGQLLSSQGKVGELTEINYKLTEFKEAVVAEQQKVDKLRQGNQERDYRGAIDRELEEARNHGASPQEIDEILKSYNNNPVAKKDKTSKTPIRLSGSREL